MRGIPTDRPLWHSGAHGQGVLGPRILGFRSRCTQRAALENARTGCVLRFWFATPGMRWDDGNRYMPVR